MPGKEKRASKSNLIDLKHLDPEDCKRCRGIAFVVVLEEETSGIYGIEPCPNGCKPQIPMRSLHIPRMESDWHEGVDEG